MRILTPDGLVRHFHVVLPRNWHELAPVPVVLAYTGAGGNAFSMADKSRMHEVCFSGRDEDQFVTVYLEPWAPLLGEDGGGSWSVGFTGDDALLFTPDDVGFTTVVLDTLQRRMSRALSERWARPGVDALDPERVYAVGFSNGGMLVYRLAVELVDWHLASICVASGCIGGQDVPTSPVVTYDPTTLASPPSTAGVLILHGRDDPVVPLLGKQPAPEDSNLLNFLELRGIDPGSWADYLPVFLSAPDAELAWQKALGLGKAGKAKQVGAYPPVFDEIRSATGPLGTVIHAYGDYAHTWPDTTGTADLIWKFFTDPTSVA